ncbi:MAG: T9SS type A sorting domain-containing protein [Bacteroidales bacterium]|nr:T9SS type A sorting domain-containing protein [Bacteroidales bacterium]
MKIKVVISTLFFCFHFQCFCQNIIFNQNDGLETTFNVSNISKITFLEDYLVVTDMIGIQLQLLLSDIQYIDFEEGDTFTNIDNLYIKSNIVKLYPIPASDVLNIHIDQSEQSKIDILIFSINGELVSQNQTIFNGLDVNINISTIHKGNYVCIISTNTKKYIAKFQKI